MNGSSISKTVYTEWMNESINFRANLHGRSATVEPSKVLKPQKEFHRTCYADENFNILGKKWDNHRREQRQKRYTNLEFEV